MAVAGCIVVSDLETVRYASTPFALGVESIDFGRREAELGQ